MAKRLQETLPQEGLGRLSQKYFGNVARKTVAKYLSGEIEPPPSALLRISKRIDIDLNWLAWGDTPNKNPPTAAGGVDILHDPKMILAGRMMWGLVATLQHIQLQAIEGRRTPESLLNVLRPLSAIVEEQGIEPIALPESGTPKVS